MAILIGILVVLATASSIDFIPIVYWSFAGLSVALIRIARKWHKQYTANIRTLNSSRLAAS